MVDDKRLSAVEQLVDQALERKGRVLFTITTASMEPAIALGDQVEVRTLGSRGPGMGDIVLFRDPVLGLLVHRVLWRWWSPGRATKLFTKGDAALRRDRALTAAEILGRVERIVRGGEELAAAPRSRILALRSAMALMANRLLGRGRDPLEVDPVHGRPESARGPATTVRQAGTAKIIDHRTTVVQSRDRPPAWEELERRPVAGTAEVGLDISGLRVRLRGLGPEQRAWFRQRYGVFAVDGQGGRAQLEVDVGVAPEEGFLQVDHSGPAEFYRLIQEVLPEDGTTRVWSYRFAGWFRPDERRGRVWFCDAEGVGFQSSLMNFLRVVYATLALRRGGFLLHSAAVVRKGRAYLLFGPSGSGKTTVSSLSMQDDATSRVLSDDLIMVLPGGEGEARTVAVSSPFRGWFAELPAAQESFPVAGFYRLVQDDRVFLEPLGPARGTSEVIGSLPFVTDRAEYGEQILGAVSRALAGAPACRLHFRKDPSFWEVLEGAGGSADG